MSKSLNMSKCWIQLKHIIKFNVKSVYRFWRKKAHNIMWMEEKIVYHHNIFTVSYDIKLIKIFLVSLKKLKHMFTYISS